MKALTFVGVAALGGLIGYICALPVMILMIGTSSTAKGIVALIGIFVGAIVLLVRRGYITRGTTDPKGGSS